MSAVCDNKVDRRIDNAKLVVCTYFASDRRTFHMPGFVCWTGSLLPYIKFASLYFKKGGSRYRARVFE